jgi:hypothetical protein
MAADLLPPVSAEARRIAAERFERANQVSASGSATCDEIRIGRCTSSACR